MRAIDLQFLPPNFACTSTGLRVEATCSLPGSTTTPKPLEMLCLTGCTPSWDNAEAFGMTPVLEAVAKASMVSNAELG